MIRVAIRVVVVLAAILITTVAGAQAQVRVDIGIHLPAPPAFVVIPGMPVYYAPQTPENVFFYGHQYWAFQGGGWYFGQSWNGPWAVVEPARVPAPILQVPVRYYRVPPARWKEWRRDAPPRWEEHYGREWREEAHERDWREREDRWARHEGKVARRVGARASIVAGATLLRARQVRLVQAGKWSKSSLASRASPIAQTWLLTGTLP